MTKDEVPARREEADDPSHEDVKPPARPVGATQIVEAIHASLYSGPIPPPEVLAHYEQILPGLADRIMRQAESQQAHRQELEALNIKSDARRSMAGLFVGSLVALAALAVAGIFAAQGHPWFGIVAVLGTIASLAGVFVYGTHTRRKERATRLEGVLNPTLDDAEEPAKPSSEPQPPQV